jgi:hypothetical protein
MQHAFGASVPCFGAYQSAVTGSRAASDLEAIRFEKNHHFRFHLRALLFLAPP